MNQQIARPAAHHKENRGADAMVRRLHGLVTYGPWNLDIAEAMSAHGYDEVKWAEGQGVLAELVTCDAPTATTLEAATAWYDEAAIIAQHALASHPRLLAKLGLSGTDAT